MGIGRGQGLVIILRAWSGCIGGWCAVQASAGGMCDCAVVVVCVSLCSRLSSATLNLCLEMKNNYWHHFHSDQTNTIKVSAPLVFSSKTGCKNVVH